MTHILLVEDKEENLYLLEALFTGHKCTVDRARHGAEALVLARKRPPDIVVSDLLMPVMDGYTLLRQWKMDSRLRRIPFVVYTATYTEPADEKLALDLGADAFILKPAEPDELMARIRAVLEREQTSAPRIGAGDGEDELLETYSQTLIRKLEEKTLQLEATNAALERDIEERERAERERKVLVHDLGERVKELRALHHVSRVLQADEGTVEDLLAAIVDGLPAAMQYPEVTAVRLEFAGSEATSDGFAATPWTLESPFRTSDGCAGVLTIAYREQRPPEDEGPFLKEERSLADSLAAMLGTHFERRRAMEQLAARDARLREQAELLDKAQDAIIVRTLDHTVRFWNKSAERLYGWTAEEAMGRRLPELFYPDTAEFDRANAAVHARGEWVGEIHQRTKDGRTLVVEGHWTLVRDEQGAAVSVLAINTDISARKAMEQQFLRAQRMESIGTLAGGIAHDLNNVLAPITMGLDLLRDAVHDADARDTLDVIAASAARGAEMVKQVLTFARGLDGRRRVVDIADPVRDVVTIARETFPKNIKIVDRVAADAWRLDGDPTQLHQVLLNLCVNARDAMPHGGSLTISVSNVRLDQQYAAMNVEAHIGPYVRLEVEDSGLGIPAAILDKIFDPFFTTKEVGKGTGLGLATSLAIVKSHHGFLRVYSEPGKGTRFRIYLPARLEETPVEPTPAIEMGPRGHGEMILVVDDEAAIRQVTASTLTAYGYRVVLAADGSEAISLFLRHRGEVRLVITDMMMPVMDGRATIEVLRRLDPTLRIVGASGLSASAGTTAAGVATTRHFLSKPFTAAVLLNTVRQALDD